MNLAVQTNAEWAIGPTLTTDGGQPVVFVDRYPINNYVTVSKKCKNPEAVFKLMNMSTLLEEWNVPGWEDTATE